MENDEIIINQFELFKLTLEQLLAHIDNELQHYPLWVSNDEKSFSSDRNQLIQSLSLLTPQDETPQATFSSPGVVACNLDTIELIKHLNLIKTQFKNNVQLFLKTKKSSDTRLIREILRRNGHGLVKLKHVYRHLKHIDYHPRRIALGHSRSSSHRIISINEAIQLLNQIGQGKHIDIQINQLYQLDKHTPLVILRKIPAHWIANVSTFKNLEGISSTTKIKSSLPVFYLHQSRFDLPIVEFAIKRSKETQRSDKKLQDEPFLPSISAYRYV